MSDVADLFPGFRGEAVPGERETIFCRIGGEGPPLLLLHGFPQSHAMWHGPAVDLARDFTVIAADLPGYGQSSIPDLAANPEGYSKRAMAREIRAAMARLGHERFALAGHDRGGRVAYRMAFDSPEALTRVAVLDILPTWEYWDRLDRAFGLKIYHWMFLAQPAPLPERMIGADPDFFMEHKFGAWALGGKPLPFAPEAFAAYRAQMRDPARVAAMCNDYRAGAGIDVAHDAADRAAGRKIAVPLLALWGTGGTAPTGEAPLDCWREWASDVRGQGLSCGHYLPEEAPAATSAALKAFFKGS